MLIEAEKKKSSEKNLKEFFKNLKRNMPPERRKALAEELRDKRKRTILKTKILLAEDKTDATEEINVFLIIPNGYFDGTLHIAFVDFHSHWAYYAADLLIGAHNGKYPSTLLKLQQNPGKGFYVDAGAGYYIPNKDMINFLLKCNEVIKQKNLEHLLKTL